MHLLSGSSDVNENLRKNLGSVRRSWFQFLIKTGSSQQSVTTTTLLLRFYARNTEIYSQG